MKPESKPLSRPGDDATKANPGKTESARPKALQGSRDTPQATSLEGSWNSERARLRLESLLHVARGARRAVILTHDNPDPDSIASALGLARLLEELLKVPSTVAYGGLIGRAENRALVKVLEIELTPVSRIVFDDFDLIGLVDTQPECGNHSVLPRYPVDIVIDHHPERASSRRAAFADVGGRYGATATIVASYLRASGLKIDAKLATALFYGIKSDTRDLGRGYVPEDVELYHWLFPQVDHQALSRIEHPEVPALYFAALHRAIGRARRHADTVLADLEEVYTPDIVAEVAERLLSLENTRWSLALGEFEGHLYFSVRTSDRSMNAGRLVRAVLEHFNGSAGGHGSMAGGRVPLFHRIAERSDPAQGEDRSNTPQAQKSRKVQAVSKARGGASTESADSAAQPEPSTGSVAMGAKERKRLKKELIAAFLREFNAPSRGQALV